MAGMDSEDANRRQIFDLITHRDGLPGEGIQSMKLVFEESSCRLSPRPIQLLQSGHARVCRFCFCAVFMSRSGANQCPRRLYNDEGVLLCSLESMSSIRDFSSTYSSLHHSSFWARQGFLTS
ncbi:hypothetical protein BDR05DRAFT_250403 [Suillus weaverae]|nr:hypothetical protein BDR05DRAFT_250403 [Suillus weaverae]